MSGNTGKRQLTVAEEHERFAVGTAVFCALCLIPVLIWYYDRPLITVPYTWFILPQMYLAKHLGGGRVASEWIVEARRVLTIPGAASAVNISYLNNSLRFLSYYLYWVYSGLIFIMAIRFMRNSDPGARFSGPFHLTGYEYKRVWYVGGIQASDGLDYSLTRISQMKSGAPIRRSLLGLAQKIGVAETRTTRIRVGRSLIAYQAQYWRNMKPLSVWDPFDTIRALDPDLRPEIWAQASGIISAETSKEITSRTSGMAVRSPLPWDHHRAEEVLRKQVEYGGRWEGIEKADGWQKAFAVICYLNYMFRQDDAIQLTYSCAEICTPIYELRASATSDEIVSTREAVKRALGDLVTRKHKDPHLPRGPLLDAKAIATINELAEPFHWTRTAMVGLLGRSGPHKSAGGLRPILQPALFGWVQSIDRTLFFALASVGSEKSLVEGMGIISQWQVEWTHWNSVSALVDEAERDIRITEEHFQIEKRHIGGGDLTALQAEYDEKMDGLRKKLDILRKERKRSPSLNMQGPLEYLEALIVRDQNVGFSVLTQKE